MSLSKFSIFSDPLCKSIKINQENEQQLLLGIRMKTFKLEELKTSIVDNFLEISANREEETNQSFIKRWFLFKFLLPESAIQEKVNFEMNSSDVLKITIPKNPAKAADQPVNIAIFLKEKPKPTS